MGLKDFAKKKILTGVGRVVAIDAINETRKQIDKHNKANSLSEKVVNEMLTSEAGDTISTKSFFEVQTTHKLIMEEKIVALRRSYKIKTIDGDIVYTAKSDGLPKLPEMGLFDINGTEIGRVEKGIMGNPMFTLDYKGKQIASLHSKLSLKPKYEIPENGWIIEGGLTKTFVYDNDGAVAIQIQYLISEHRGSVIVEYVNQENEVPALLIALAMIIAYHMG